MSEDEQDRDGVSVHAGFPNPATDKSLGSLDLNQLLVRRTASTFLFRVRGAAGEEFGIFDGDIAVVDRALDPRKADLVIWWSEDEFRIAKFTNLKSPTIWGVITSTIHQLRAD